MKKFLLFIALLTCYSQTQAQEWNKANMDISYLIKDTVKTPLAGNYYLVDATKVKSNHPSIVRKASADYLVIKATQTLYTQKTTTYYLLDDSWKLSSGLFKRKLSLYDEHVFSIKYADDAVLDFLSQKNAVEVIRIIKNANIAIIKTSMNFIENELIENENLEYIDLAERKAQEESPIRQHNFTLNGISNAKHNYPNIKGKGMVISLKENSIAEDIDLIGKVILNENSSMVFTQHAKEMGTLIAGLGNSFKTGEGVVPWANLICTNFSSLFAEDIKYYSSNNIKVQNHSYGTGIENFYSNETISYDQISLDQPELVHVFSSGNMGDHAPEDGIYEGITGFANLTGTYKQAKNTLVIAALDSGGNHVVQSSSGPTYDGRIKPELSAFGGEGSSESTALASGCVAMLQNHYLNAHGLFPSSALIKSLLIAGADDVHTSGIDFKTGYGSINLNRSLQLLDSGSYFEGVIGSNDSHSMQIVIPDDVAELKVVVSWLDPPAQPEDANALVHDLDMNLVSPMNTISLPWILNASPDANSLAAPPIRGEDHLNNVEMISIENPVSGNYTLNISSNQLIGEGQNFSIAFCIKMKGKFEWTFPNASDNLEANTRPYIRWINTFPKQNGNLSIKYGDGAWEVLGQAELIAKQYKISLKDTSIYVQLKMALPSMEYLSDTFTISSLPRIKVENDCDDNFILSWNQIENTGEYLLYELQSDQLIHILSAEDTIVKLDKTAFDGVYYSVQPIQYNMMQGLRSYSINYENSNKGCYIDNFLAFLDVDKFANITLSINIPHEINQITIEKEYQRSTEVFKQFPPDGETNFTFEDHDLIPGRYSYLTSLTLNDGKTIVSDTLSLFYTDVNTVIVFPNPVQDDFVSILNDYPGGILYMFDEKGAFIRQYYLEYTIDDLDLTGMRNGVYIFRISYNGEIVNSGKIIRF